ncbi:NUDIX domain-containing protein [Paracoccus ravus]|uniref:NUDIX domain-containing protein n=1 Tax=Paracoccus ravus TaxID=2447760 RepID=UPI00106E8609|nr:NUDIX hydrolase [Paracoccus ravus]
MIRCSERPEKGRKYQFRPGAYGLLIRDGAALVTFKADPEAEFQLPGGGVDPGESPIHALHREAREETGWTLSTPRWIGAYRRYCYMQDEDVWAEKLCSVWLARPVLQVGPPRDPAHSAHWVAPRELTRILADPGARQIAGRLLAFG